MKILNIIDDEYYKWRFLIINPSFNFLTWKNKLSNYLNDQFIYGFSNCYTLKFFYVQIILFLYLSINIFKKSINFSFRDYRKFLFKFNLNTKIERNYEEITMDEFPRLTSIFLTS